MTMEQMDSALRLIHQHAAESHFAGPRAPELIEAAERALGVIFPPTYKRFLLDLGAGGIGSAEFYGVIDENFTDSAVPDAIWLTLDNRRTADLPNNLIIVSETGDGAWYALDTARPDTRGECPVVIWAYPEPIGPPVQVVASDFGEFFIQKMKPALARLGRQPGGP